MGVNTFNIDKLLKPYTDGGTVGNRVKRTLGTITSKLIVANKIPPDAVGLAIYETFEAIANKGLVFKGTDKYGSSGHELYIHIKKLSVKYAQARTTEMALQKIVNATCCIKDCSVRSKKLEVTTKWMRFKKAMLKPRGFFWSF